MNILYVTKNLPFGSAEAFIYEEVEDHLAAGWDVTIAPVGRGPLVHERGRKLLPKTLAKPLIDLAILCGAAKQLVRRPLAVACTLRRLLATRPTLWPRNLAVLPKALWLAGEVRRRGITHIHAHWIAVPATMAVVAARLAGVPVSITAHRYDIAQRNLVPWKFASAIFVRAIDTPGVEELAAQLPAGTPGPLLIRMGVAPVAIPALLRGGPLRPLHALIGARLIDKKGHATLFDALAQARADGLDVTLDIFGDGPLESALRAQAERLAIGDLTNFAGPLSHDALLERLRGGAYDVAVLPSVTAADGDKEGIPVFLMEAMAAGLPVVATPNGGIAELIDGANGLLVPERDAPALAAALRRLSDEPETRTALAAQARETIATRFSTRATSAHLRALMQGAAA